jgi:hypothetical protein
MRTQAYACARLEAEIAATVDAFVMKGYIPLTHQLQSQGGYTANGTAPSA